MRKSGASSTYHSLAILHPEQTWHSGSPAFPFSGLPDVWLSGSPAFWLYGFLLLHQSAIRIPKSEIVLAAVYRNLTISSL